MSEGKDARPTPPGLYDRGAKTAITGLEMTALGVIAVWLVLSGIYFLSGRGNDAGGLQFLLTLMVMFLPAALIWVATMTARSSRVMQEENARLRAAIDAIRTAYVTQVQSGRSEQPHPAILKRLDDLATAQKHLQDSLTLHAAAQAAEPAPQKAEATAEADAQPTLSLGTPAEDLQPPLPNEDFIRALHFPETAEDDDGFAALRRALRDRNVAQLVQAAQDILTLLSQDGIYMDDLRPDLARPEIWRAFAQGTRGRTIAALGGVRDRTSLALAAGRMKQDPIFRDAAHHFLRRFDKSFASFEDRATDAEITAFASTRTARAFMLLGRVAGTFD